MNTPTTSGTILALIILALFAVVVCCAGFERPVAPTQEPEEL